MSDTDGDELFEESKAHVCFLGACDRIRKNDPSFTRLELSLLDSVGFGPILGQALRQNSHLAFMHLSVNKFYSGQEPEGTHRSAADDVLNFLRDSTSLEGVDLDFEHCTDQNEMDLTGWMLE
jgi:hypothetical protein